MVNPDMTVNAEELVGIRQYRNLLEKTSEQYDANVVWQLVYYHVTEYDSLDDVMNEFRGLHPTKVLPKMIQELPRKNKSVQQYRNAFSAPVQRTIKNIITRSSQSSQKGYDIPGTNLEVGRDGYVRRDK